MNENANLFQELIDQKSWKDLKQALHNLEPVEIADIIEASSSTDQLIIFRLLSREMAKETFQHLSHEEQEDIIEGLAKNSSKISELLNDLDPDDRTAFFEELPGQVSQRLVQMLSLKERAIATKLLGYPEDSIGRLMTPEYVALKPYFTVREALEHIRIFGRDSETLNVVYVVDERWNLIGDIRIKTIILASLDQKISEIVETRSMALNAYDDQEIAVKIFQEYDRIALPVIDTDGTLLGIVTFDDVMDVVEEEHTEDFQRFGSLTDVVVNPLKAKIAYLYRQRIVWLFALVFMNVFSGAALAHFESVLQSVISLVFFLPLLIASGGNAGSQSATLMIRALAVGDVRMKDWFQLVGKEFLVSLLLGITMAAGVSVVAHFRAPDAIIVVAITMVCTVIVGSIIGMLLPFVFTKLKVDPATASAPLITSIADICGIVIYFTIATAYFGL